MKVSLSLVALLAIAPLGISRAHAQADQTRIPTAIDSTMVIDAAGPLQRKSVKAIYLVVCPNSNAAGTGFLLDSGVMVTNAHVVGPCQEDTLFALSATNERIQFTKIIADRMRDLALILPRDRLTGGFRLSVKDNPEPGTTVSTWGFPFVYNKTSPLLSVGYVAGFRTDDSSGSPVKHIVVNGAFNHGNSGGPLLVSHSNEVIGIVVLTYHFYPPQVRRTIDSLEGMNFGMMIAETQKPDGTKQAVSDLQVIGSILDEFYQKTQVMIGEAVSASELRAMLREHSSDLPARQTSRARAVVALVHPVGH
jgi:S1-C subfamily serine protease